MKRTKVLPKKITNNLNNWKSSNKVEFYVDFETTRLIVRRFHGGKSKGETTDSVLEYLLFKRADIVKNVDEKYKELKSKGYEITELKEGKSIKKYFFVKDPDGFIMKLCEKY